MGTRLLTALVLALGFASLGAATDGFRAITTEGARRLEVEASPRPVPQVAMVDHLGRPFGWEALAGSSVLVEFIFTTCPDLCQKMSSDFAALYRAESLSEESRVRFLSITFDPENDTDERLRAVAEHYGADGERWRFARIDDRSELAATLEAFGIVAVRSETRRFEHNAAIHGMNGQGELARIADVGLGEEMLQWARER